MSYTIEKRNHHGKPVFSYTGEVVELTKHHACVIAVFGRDDVNAGYVIFRKGDVMTEWFYTDRWYNIFRLQDVDSQQLKGWYCNITRPAVIAEKSLHADDLALDVFINPTGDFMLLDEDEFAALELSAEERAQALAAVEDLRGRVMRREETFAEIKNA
jgi:protein associated with RNAse G/E